MASLIVAAVLAVPVAAYARGSVPIVNYENQTVTTGSGKAASADAVRKAIITAGANARRKWTSSTVDGKLRLTYNVRAHSMSVEVTNTASTYSLRYADSSNLNYSAENGGVIHPNYNAWVRELKSAIDTELSKL